MHLQHQMALLHRLRYVVAWIGFLLLWTIFVFQVSIAELVIGAVVSALTMAFACFALKAVPVCFEPRLQWLAQAARLPWMFAVDIAPLLRHAARELGGKPSHSSVVQEKIQTVPDECAAMAQRAIAALLISTSPNSIVVDLNNETGKMLVHQIEPSSDSGLIASLQA